MIKLCCRVVAVIPPREGGGEYVDNGNHSTFVSCCRSRPGNIYAHKKITAQPKELAVIFY